MSPAPPPNLIRERRRDEIVSIQQRIGEEFAESLVGRDVDVLVDGFNDDGFLIGRTQVKLFKCGPSFFPKTAASSRFKCIH